MRLSELGGKEIVDLQKAERLGILGQTDLEINRETGEIHELIIPTGKWVRKGGGNSCTVEKYSNDRNRYDHFRSTKTKRRLTI